MGPILFSLFINDLTWICHYCSIHLYADGTTVHFNGKSVSHQNIKLFFFIFWSLSIFFNSYNVVLVSAIQQHKSAMIIHPYPPSIPCPIPSRQVITEHQTGLPVLLSNFSPAIHLTQYLCWYYFLHLSHSLPPLLRPQVHSLHLCLHFFPTNGSINTISLD